MLHMKNGFTTTSHPIVTASSTNIFKNSLYLRQTIFDHVYVGGIKDKRQADAKSRGALKSSLHSRTHDRAATRRTCEKSFSRSRHPTSPPIVTGMSVRPQQKTLLLATTAEDRLRTFPRSWANAYEPMGPCTLRSSSR